MLNLSVIPDFLAIGGLVTVFGSLARRTRQTRLGYWLLGWVLILVHIAAQFVQRNLPAGPAGDTALAVSLATLLMASVTYLWAALDTRSGWSRDLGLMALATAPDILVFVLACYGLQERGAYLGCTAAGFAASAWVYNAGRRKADRRAVPHRLGVLLVAYGVQAGLVLHGALAGALTWMLFWHYLAAAFCFYRGASRPTAGVLVTTISFVAWAAVFPLGLLFGHWAGAVGIENEAWNLPKFLVAAGMIVVLLEGQIKRAEHASLHDALTGLPNRRVFSTRLAEALQQARTTSGRVAVLVADLDDFKQVNDTAGHMAGDVLLRFAAARMQEVLREGDTLVRLGGDEFAAILPAIPDRATAEQLAGRLAQALEAEIDYHGGPLGVRASVGVAVYPEDGQDESRLYAAADLAMYGSKRARPADQDTASLPAR